MKILLADDERMVRIGLESLLCELYPREHTYLHAKNGKEVVDIVKDENPDIVFIDIKMPIMDGLEAIETCREFNHDTQYVILSGYSDFSFAKQAINLGVEAYLLKPINVEELTPIMEEFEAKKLEKFNSENNIFRYEISSYYALPDSVAMGTYPNLPTTSCPFQVYLFIPDSTASTNYMEAEKKLNSIMPEIRKKLTSLHMYFACFTTNTGEKIIFTLNNNPGVINEYLILLLHKEGLSQNYTIIYNEWNDIRKLCTVAKETISISSLRLIKTKELFISRIDQDFFESHEKYSALLQIIDDLLIQWPLTDKEHVLITLARFEEEDPLGEDSFQTLYNEIYSGHEVYNLKERICGPLGLDNVPSDLDAFIAAVKEKLDNRENLNFKNVSTTLEHICDYIKNNYRVNFGSDFADESLSYSSRYCCRIFKMFMGQTMIEYAIVLRIELAKKILKERDNISMEVLAASIGFNNVRTFSKLFMEYTGMIPTEYQIKSKEENL